MPRKAVVKGSTLTWTCMTYELQGQIDQLNVVMSASNDSYKTIAEQAAARQDGEFRDLKDSLRHD